MAQFLFVHGSWHGSWCWDHVVKGLKAAGHTARAIDLPGHGEDSRDPADVTLAHYGAAIRAELSEMGGSVILVGHSMGGFAISAACRDLANHVSRIVYIAALVPLHNDTLVDVKERHIPEPRLLDVSVEVEGLVGVVKPDCAHDLFYTDCNPEQTGRFIGNLRPEPLMPMLTPVQVADKSFAAIPKMYVECTKDKTIPLGAQRGMLRDAGITDVISLQSAHSPFFSMPDRLIEILGALEESRAA